MSNTDAIFTLDRMSLGTRCVVHAVQVPAHASEWAQRLEEIGFLAGEQVTLMARGVPGGNSLAGRVSASSFAPRRAKRLASVCLLRTGDFHGFLLYDNSLPSAAGSYGYCRMLAPATLCMSRSA